MLKLLIKFFDVNDIDEEGRTVLYYALIGDSKPIVQLEIFEILIKNGADINLIDEEIHR